MWFLLLRGGCYGQGLRRSQTPPSSPWALLKRRYHTEELWGQKRTKSVISFICSVSSSSTAVFFFYKVFLALENGLISFRHVPVWDWFLCSFSQCKWELLNWTWHESVFFIFHPNILGIETLFCVLCHFSDAEKQTFLDPFTLGIKLCEYQL